MLKTIGVFGLVLIEIGGIHKKVIFPTNNVVRPLSHTRQAKSLGISNMHRMTVIASQIFAVFEANPRRSIPIAISQRSPTTQHTPVICRQHHCRVSLGQLAQHLKKRRMREPGPRQRPISRLIGRHFLQQFGFGTAVCEHIQKIDHHCHKRKRPVRMHLLRQPVTLCNIQYLDVARIQIQFWINFCELLIEQLMFVSVATHVVVTRDLPLIGVQYSEINGKKTAENGIARIRRRSGQNRVVVVLLNVENIGQQRQNGKPVIQSHTIDHHKKHLLPILHTGRDKFGYNIHRKRG